MDAASSHCYRCYRLLAVCFYTPTISCFSSFRAGIRLPFAHLYVFNALRNVLQSRFPQARSCAMAFLDRRVSGVVCSYSRRFYTLFQAARQRLDTYRVGVGVHYLPLCIGGSHRYAEVGWQHRGYDDLHFPI